MSFNQSQAMGRLVVAALMTGVLGCGSADEPTASTPASRNATKGQTRKSESAQAEKLIADGQRRLEEEDYAVAIEAFSAAIQLDDQNAVAYRERARTRMCSAGHGDFFSTTLNLGNTEIVEDGHAVDRLEKRVFQTALADLKIAIRLDTSDVESYKLHGRCLMELGDSDRAIAAFDKAIRLAPQDADAYHKRGIGYSQANDQAKAIADFDRAIELDPKSVKSLLARAMSRSLDCDVVGSLADFDAAILLDGSNYRAYANRSLAYLRLRDFEKAAGSCTKAIELAPQQWCPYFNRGIAYLQLEEPSKAIADFTKAISLDSGQFEPHGNLASAYIMTGLFPKALIEIDTAIKLAPNVGDLHRIRSELLVKMGRLDESLVSRRKAEWTKQLPQLNQAVIRRPKNPQGYQRRAVHYADDEQWENAISDFNKAVQLKPDSVDALVGRAKAWLAQGEFQQAIDDCNKALKHASGREVYSLCGDAFLGLDDYDRAIANYERAKRFDPQVAQAYLLRSKQRKAAGQTSAADKDFQNAIAIDPSLSGLQ